MLFPKKITGAIPDFVRLLNSPDQNVREQSIWALGNIAGDSPELRDMVLKENVIEPLQRIIVSKPKTTIMRNATWTLSNLCRGKPIPDFELVKNAVPILCTLLYHVGLYKHIFSPFSKKKTIL